MGKLIITEDEKKHIIGLYEQSMGGMLSGQGYAKASTEGAKFIQRDLTFDDLITLTSAMVDGVPGIGNLISLGIDYTHAISFFVRSFISNNEEDKVQYFISGIVLLLMAELPIAGNILSMASSHYLKSIMRQSPNQIVKFLGIKTFNLSKGKWKYCVVALFLKLFKTEAIGRITSVKNTIKPFLDLPLGKPYKDSINYVSNVLDELIEIAGQSKPNYNVQII